MNKTAPLSAMVSILLSIKKNQFSTAHYETNRSVCVRGMYYFKHLYRICDRLCGLVVRVPGYRSRGPSFNSRRYQIFWEVVGLVRGPLRLVSITEELLGRKSSGSGLESPEYGRGDLLRWPRDTLYPQKLALISPICGGRSVDIVRLRTKTTEFVFCFVYIGYVLSAILSKLTCFEWEAVSVVATFSISHSGRQFQVITGFVLFESFCCYLLHITTYLLHDIGRELRV
jgi:hypothetical protein